MTQWTRDAQAALEFHERRQSQAESELRVLTKKVGPDGFPESPEALYDTLGRYLWESHYASAARQELTDALEEAKISQ